MDNEGQSKVEEPVTSATTPNQENLKGSWQLLKEACGEYRARFATSLAIFSVPIVLALLLSGLSYATMFPPFAYMPLLSVVKVVLSLLSLCAGILAGFALLLSVREGYGAGESLVQAIWNSLPYIFVSFLMCSSLIGGSILFLIPGLLFLVWFSFSFFTFVFEGRRGIDALLRSKQLVSGNFWKVVGRISFLAILLLVFTVPLSILGQYAGHWKGFMLETLTLVLVPVMLFYSLFLFRDLVRIQENIAPSVSKTSFKVFVWLCVLLGTPFIVGVILFQSMLLVTHDIPEPNDSDLRLSTVNVPQEENAYYVFSEVKEGDIFWPSEKGLDTMLSGKTWDESVVQEVLQKNEKALQVFERGVMLSVYQQPGFQNMDTVNFNTITGDVTYLRKLARLNSLQALSLFWKGKEKEAVEQTFKTVKMAEMLWNGRNSTIHALVGLASKRIGLETLWVIVGRSRNLSSIDLIRDARNLSLYERGGESIQTILMGEYTVMSNSFETGDFEDLLLLTATIFQKEFPPFCFYYYLPNQTKLLSMESLESGIENSKKSSYSQVRFSEKERIDFPEVVFTRNAIGKILTLTVRESLYESLIKKGFENDLIVRISQILLALKAYEQDRGTLPSSLRELVPAYLPEVPQDPFDGKEIRYVPERRILYSTGEDLNDDGGDIDEENWQGGKDLGFRVK